MADPGVPAGSGVFGPGTGITESAPGRGSTAPTAGLDEPEMRNAQRGGRVFRPSDHYFVNGVDMGPSWDALPGTGGPSKIEDDAAVDGPGGRRHPWTGKRTSTV